MSFQIYNASAGSGKTYTLTKQYLKIVLQANENDAYKKILAITFTNKAVEEMKHRIVQSLIDFSEEFTPDDSIDLLNDLVSELNLKPEIIKQKAAKVLKNIIHNYASFDVATIDKFTLRIIKTFAQDLKLPANFEVILDTDVLLRNAIEIVLAKAGTDKELTEVLINFAKAKADDDKSWDITNDIYLICKEIIKEEHFEKLNLLETKSLIDFKITKQQILERIELKKTEISGLLQIIIKSFEENNLERKDFSGGYFYDHILKLLDFEDYTYFNSNYCTNKEIKSQKTNKNAGLVESLIPFWQEYLVAIYEKTGQLKLLEQVTKNIIPVSLMNLVYQEYKTLQAEENGLSIADFNKIIHNEIKNQPAPFIYERIGSRYENYFIDEFQDTSEMQWQNFIPLIENAIYAQNMQNKPGSLLLVGDPKQAIYRFRGGKAEQFIELSDETNKQPFPFVEKTVKNLETNYRSYSNIINFNNNFFKYIASVFKNPDYQNLYKNLSHQQKNSKIGGKVTLNFVLKEKTSFSDEDENDDKDSDNYDDILSDLDKKYLHKTIEIIKKCQNDGFKLSDMVILTRAKRDGVILANFLTQNNIKIVSSETLLIQNAAEVKFLISFLEYINDQNNVESKINWLYFITNNLLKTNNKHQFLFDAKNLESHDLEVFLANYGYVFSIAALKTKSLYDAVENLIATFIPHKATISYVMYFVDLVLERDIKLQASIADFLTYWCKIGYAKSIPSPEGQNAIKIMTIHKSKGLEFPVVIFPFIKEQLSSNREKIWLNLNEEGIDYKESIISKKNDFEIINDEAATKINQRNQEVLLDIVNIVYVAFTRAKQQLHLVSSFEINAKNEAKKDNNFSKHLIGFLENENIFDVNKLEYVFEYDVEIKKPNIQKENKLKNQEIEIVNEKLNFQAIKIAKREALMWGSKQKEAIEFGNIVHEIISFVKYKNDVNLAITKGVEKGLITENDAPIFKETIIQIVNHPDLNDFFNTENIILNEHSILSETETIKPDRIEVNGKNAFLLDYKTGAQMPKHNKQLLNYQNALEKMNFVVLKKCLVYIGEDIKVIHL